MVDRLWTPAWVVAVWCLLMVVWPEDLVLEAWSRLVDLPILEFEWGDVYDETLPWNGRVMVRVSGVPMLAGMVLAAALFFAVARERGCFERSSPMTGGEQRVAAIAALLALVGFAWIWAAIETTTVSIIPVYKPPAYWISMKVRFWFNAVSGALLAVASLGLLFAWSSESPRLGRWLLVSALGAAVAVVEGLAGPTFERWAISGSFLKWEGPQSLFDSLAWAVPAVGPAVIGLWAIGAWLRGQERRDESECPWLAAAESDQDGVMLPRLWGVCALVVGVGWLARGLFLTLELLDSDRYTIPEEPPPGAAHAWVIVLASVLLLAGAAALIPSLARRASGKAIAAAGGLAALALIVAWASAADYSPFDQFHWLYFGYGPLIFVAALAAYLCWRREPPRALPAN